MTTDPSEGEVHDPFIDADRTLTGVAERAARAGVTADIDRIAVVWFHGLVVGNCLVEGFDELTPEEWRGGVTVGAITIADRRGQGLAAGETRLGDPAYRVVATVPVGASAGQVDLFDATGQVVASVGLSACAPRIESHTVIREKRQPAASIVGKIGRASISAGKWYVCFDYDDPPGAPNAKCWEWCLRIPEPPRDPGPIV